MYAYVCVYPQGYKQLVAGFGLHTIGFMIPVASQLRFMALSIDIMHDCHPSNKMCP